MCGCVLMLCPVCCVLAWPVPNLLLLQLPPLPSLTPPFAQEDVLVAYQVAFDMYESAMQHYQRAVQEALRHSLRQAGEAVPGKQLHGVSLWTYCFNKMHSVDKSCLFA